MNGLVSFALSADLVHAMPNPPWRFTRGDGPIVAVALHSGHELSATFRASLGLSDELRRREEDPYTGYWTTVGDHAIVVDRSRFEIDLNRARTACVYVEPAHAWNLDLWAQAPPDELLERSRRLHDSFYALCESLLTETARRHGGFVVLDLHSYNHRRGGPQTRADDPVDNPEINVGTESIDCARWGAVIETFCGVLRSRPVRDRVLDVRENVRFRGGYFPRWVNHHFGHVGCAIAIEVKKFFMDEWTDAVDWSLVGEIRSLLADAAQALRRLE